MAKRGHGDLAVQEQRLAYGLLAPTFVVLLAIAIYPLFSVFYNSFTNNVFASATPTEVVVVSTTHGPTMALPGLSL